MNLPPPRSVFPASSAGLFCLLVFGKKPWRRCFRRASRRSPSARERPSRTRPGRRGHATAAGNEHPRVAEEGANGSAAAGGSSWCTTSPARTPEPSSKEDANLRGHVGRRTPLTLVAHPANREPFGLCSVALRKQVGAYQRLARSCRYSSVTLAARRAHGGQRDAEYAATGGQ